MLGGFVSCYPKLFCHCTGKDTIIGVLTVLSSTNRDFPGCRHMLVGHMLVGHMLVGHMLVGHMLVGHMLVGHMLVEAYVSRAIL